MKGISLFITIVLCLLTVLAYAVEAEGYVFMDLNKNGIRDKGEKGLPGIAVSDQRTIVLTNTDGKYCINTEPGNFIFVIKPAGYDFTGVQGNGYGFYKKVGTGDWVDFALTQKKVKTKFTALMIGDPQMRGELSLNAFQEDIVTELLYSEADFACILGDIADNDLSIYPREKEITGQLPYPVYHVFGNHDIDEQAVTAKDASGIFSRYYGPDYFSFNEGDVHFVVLNNIVYHGWDKEDNERGDYFGGLLEAQNKWLEKDLQQVSDDKLIVIMSHIPFLEQYTDKVSIARLFSLLEKRSRSLLLSGHLHYVENQFLNKHSYWGGKQPVQSLTVGAACGSWWTGPLDERGLPVATCIDGAPNGYFRLDFDGSKYNYHFIPANNRSDFQMRIMLSSDSLKAGNLSDEFLSVNVFAASPQARVSVQIDEALPVWADNNTGIDPFIQSTYDLRYNFDNWRPKLQHTRHLWKLKLPRFLSPGLHKVKVTATDIDGKKYEGFKLFNVKK
ncbi:calcineurin-like phosphoesterase C-terminal domain-containing protein [Niabella aquatica]